jgi:two-component system OmpR family response regulator
VTHVLIADNDPAVSSLLREILERGGLSVRQAFDGDAARSLVRDPGVAVLVCDLDMPRASGLDVLESMTDLAPVPPAVVVSGYLDGAISERLRRLAHVRDVMRKPFDLLAFAARVRELATAGTTSPADRDAASRTGGHER